MAFACLVSGLVYWAQLLGITGAGAARFDLIAVDWRICSTVLAVVLPLACLGLWLKQAWGVVLWVIAMGIEISVYGIWAERFVERPNTVIANSASLVVLLLLSGAVMFETYRHRRAGGL